VLRDFQARWESLFFDFSTERLFNSFFRRGSFHDRFALAGVASQPLRSVGDADGCVQVLMDGHSASCQCAAPTDFFNLQVEVLKVDRVVLVDRALAMDGKDQIQIAPPARNKGRAFLGLPALEIPD
jgi:hypothetical protein